MISLHSRGSFSHSLGLSNLLLPLTPMPPSPSSRPYAPCHVGVHCPPCQLEMVLFRLSWKPQERLDKSLNPRTRSLWGGGSEALLMIN